MMDLISPLSSQASRVATDETLQNDQKIKDLSGIMEELQNLSLVKEHEISFRTLVIERIEEDIRDLQNFDKDVALSKISYRNGYYLVANDS